jgi:hypothetical protein
MKFLYQTVKLGTVADIKEAERLQRNGWKIVSHNAGSQTVLMEKINRIKKLKIFLAGVDKS